jgi:uncharacterized membrane protein YgcG
MNIFRFLKHILTPGWLARRAFSAAVRERIEHVIHESETLHRGEIRFAIESGFALMPLLKGITARARAIAVFSDLRVWDTAENTGVLVYLQLVDRDIEIVADRGINACVTQGEWESICQRMEAAFRESRFEEGVIAGLREITALLVRHFPARSENTDELPNKPVML